MRRSTRIRTPPVVTVKTEANTVSQTARAPQNPHVVYTGKRSLSVLSSQADGVKKIKVEAETNTATITVKHELSSYMIKNEIAHHADWHDLCAVVELSCALTLPSGQVFTWKRYAAESDVWIGVVGKHVYKLRERDHRVQYQLVHPPHLSMEDAVATLYDYFHLEVEVAPLYAKWSEKDDDMSKIIRSLPGLRIIRQDPVECLFAFICSSNNNIQRITQMITKLKATYGELLYHDPVSDEQFFAFPSVETLATRVEEHTLRELGFGYRAPFIVKSSVLLKELGGREYLAELRKVPPSGNGNEYAEKLMAFSGVGRKVADCIGLFALNKLHAIPVDTHVWQIAIREFDPALKNKKSLTPTVYQAVGDHFRARFSPLAGWAHSVLFAGDLTIFKSHLPIEMQQKKKLNPKAKRPVETKLRAKPKVTTSNQQPSDPTREEIPSKGNQKRKR